MASLPEFVGTVHIFLGPYRGNPIALYLQRDEDETTCHIAPRIYPWNRTIGSGETPNKAAAAFEVKWKAGDLTAEMYSGPHWEGGIKPEKPKPPPKPAAPKPAAAATTGTPKPETAPAATEKSPAPSPPAATAKTAESAPAAAKTPPPAATAESSPTTTTSSASTPTPSSEPSQAIETQPPSTPPQTT